MEEIWKDVVGYEGLYQVSNFGKVQALRKEVIDTIGRHSVYKPHILPQSINRGYYYVSLTKNKVRKSKAVHRLVAEAFIPNPNNLPQVGHKDENNLRTGNECNNNVNNLYWTSAKDNCNMPKYKERISEKSKGENNWCYGKHLSEEHKKKISENHANVSGEHNGFYGRHHTEETKKKMRRPIKCLETNQIFNCAGQAGEFVNIDRRGITNCCRGKQKTAGGYHWEYADNE